MPKQLAEHFQRDFGLQQSGTKGTPEAMEPPARDGFTVKAASSYVPAHNGACGAVVKFAIRRIFAQENERFLTRGAAIQDVVDKGISYLRLHRQGERSACFVLYHMKF